MKKKEIKQHAAWIFQPKYNRLMGKELHPPLPQEG